MQSDGMVDGVEERTGMKALFCADCGNQIGYGPDCEAIDNMSLYCESCFKAEM
jgi:hypothetical protein